MLKTFISDRGGVTVADKVPAAKTPAVQEMPAVPNEISEQTGELDARFVLWRDFCGEYNIPVETLPSDLTGEAKEKWETLKEEELHKPAEDR